MKTQTTFTPGPWTVKQQPDLDQSGNGYTWAIKAKAHASYTQNPAYANSEANARLIASAPELLEALQECIAWFDLDTHHNHPIMAHDTEIGFRMIQKIRAAIAKARGQK